MQIRVSCLLAQPGLVFPSAQLAIQSLAGAKLPHQLVARLQVGHALSAQDTHKIITIQEGS